MAVEVELKRWGNSFGVVLPKDIVNERKLKEKDKIVIEIVKVANLSKIYGMIKERKMLGQEDKNLARRGWESSSDMKKWKG